MNESIRGMKQNLIQALGPLRHWYQQRQQREQVAIQILVWSATAMFLYLAVWQPVIKNNQRAVERYERQLGVFEWIQDNADAVQGIAGLHGAGSGDATANSGNWINIINTSAAAEGIALKGFTPEGSDAVRVTLENAEFAGVLSWLYRLQASENIRASNVDFSPGQQSGTVTVRATLRRSI